MALKNKTSPKTLVVVGLKGNFTLSLPSCPNNKIMKIGKDTIAEIIYTLRADDAEGDMLEEVNESEPMQVLFGHEVMLEVLEEKLQGLQAGDDFEFIISEEQGYGAYDEEKVITVPEVELLSETPEGQEVAQFNEGDSIPVKDMDGMEYEAMVLEKKDGKVTLDFNHPLAGETLHFKGKVLNVRKATQEEIKQETSHE